MRTVFGRSLPTHPSKLASRGTLLPRWGVVGACMLFAWAPASSCKPELGEANPVLARDVVLFFGPGDSRTGIPMYAGQAIMQRSCSNGICHSSSAEGKARNGVPAELDFDLTPTCTLEGGECTDEDQLEELHRARDRVVEHARAILAEVEAETMPPSGSEGAAVRAAGGQYYYLDNFSSVSGGERELPELDTAEGREILRIWLASRAPMIDRMAPPGDFTSPGEPCSGEDDETVIFGCVVRAEPPPPPDPNWASIYAFFEGSCVASCHDGDEDLGVYEDSLLDLSTQELAYQELLGAAEGDDCGGMGDLVVPNDPEASILIDKLQNEDPSCGASMPAGLPILPENYLAPIIEWVNNGAPES